MLDNRKIMEISQMIQDTNDTIAGNPPKEVRLIEAMKPFVSGTQHKSLDNTIEMLNKIHAFKAISSQIVPKQTPPYAPQYTMQNLSQDNSVHNDGVYDFDASCVGKKSKINPQIGTMLMMMALLGKMNS